MQFFSVGPGRRNEIGEPLASHCHLPTGGEVCVTISTLFGISECQSDLSVSGVSSISEIDISRTRVWTALHTVSFAVSACSEQGQNLECPLPFDLPLYFSSLFKRMDIVDIFFLSSLYIFPAYHLNRSYFLYLLLTYFSFSLKTHLQKADVHTESEMDSCMFWGSGQRRSPFQFF